MDEAVEVQGSLSGLWPCPGTIHMGLNLWIRELQQCAGCRKPHLRGQWILRLEGDHEPNGPGECSRDPRKRELQLLRRHSPNGSMWKSMREWECLPPSSAETQTTPASSHIMSRLRLEGFLLVQRVSLDSLVEHRHPTVEAQEGKTSFVEG